MSHFSVMVIGQNVEQQLAPYHEFECTGINDQYVQNVDITANLRKLMTDDGMSLQDALECHGLEERVISSESDADTDGEDATHKYGYAVVVDGELIKAVDRTNPNKEWDWWVLGGRWSGFLKLKEGAEGIVGRKGLLGSCSNDKDGWVDSACKGDIDIDSMRNEAGDKAAEQWDMAAKAKNKHGYSAEATWDDWNTVRDRHPGKIEDAREEYNAQPVMKAVAAVFDNPFRGVDEFLIPREKYIQNAKDRAISTYAVVIDGQWIAKGEMGWFGCSNEKVSEAEWNLKMNWIFDSLPDDTLISIVDCHI